MEKWKTKAPDGSVFTIEAPDNATKEQLTAIVRQRQAVGPSPEPTGGTTNGGPDFVGRAKERALREPPAPFSTPTGRIFRGLADVILPGTVPEAARFAATLPIGGGMVTGPLMRTGAGVLAGSIASLLQGQDPMSALTEGGSQGLSQLAGEVLPGALRFGLTQRAGQRALGERAAVIGQRGISEGAVAKFREETIAHDTAMDKALTSLESEGYKRDVGARRTAEAARLREARAQHQERAGATKRDFAAAEAARQAQHKAAVTAATERHAANVRAYEESGAQIIADGFKQQVPAFRDFPSNESGLLNMVSGEGPARMSARFDETMKGIVAAGKNALVEIPHQDAKALDLTGIRTMKGEGGRVTAIVNAGQLAEKATGYWKKDHGVYRRAVAALDKANLGDPQARAEYKAGRALLDFAESSQMLKGQKFNPEAARAAFDRVKKLDALRKRGQGDMFTGPVAAAVNRPAPQLSLPGDFAPLPEPVIPPFRRPAPLPDVVPPARRVVNPPPELSLQPPLSPTPEGVTTRTLPTFPWWEGAALAEAPFLLMGVAHGGYGLPALAGAAAAHGLSGRQLFTAAPLSPAMELSLRALPGFEAQAARRLMGAR